MHRRIASHIRSNLVAYLALFVALGGTGVAATRLKNNSVTTRKIRNGAVTGPKIAGGSVTAEKLAVAAGGALAGSYPNPALKPAEPWHEVGADLSTCDGGTNAWENVGGVFSTAAYFRDPYGMVHVKGIVKCPAAADVPSFIFFVSPGYRSEASEQFPARSDDGDVVLRMSPLVGSLVLVGGSSGAGQSVMLDGISWRCAPSGVDGCP